MDLARILDKLPALGERSIWHYGRDGRLARRTYPELASDVEAARARLTRWGVRAGARVGLLSENCYSWVVHDLALLACGAVSLPFPVEEFTRASYDELAARYGLHLLLVSDRQRRPGVASPPWVAALEDGSPEAVGAVAVRDPGGRAGERNSDVFSLDPDVYTLVFSSGTSGKLKCLVISRRGTEALIETFGRLYRFQPDDSILAFLPLANFQQRWMLYTALAYGFDFCVVEPARLFKGLKEMRPTLLGAPPLFYETIANRFSALPTTQRRALLVAGRLAGALPWPRLRRRLQRRLFAPFHDSLGGRARLMLTGAAPIARATLELFALLGLPLYEGYGLTETGYVTLNLPGRNRIGSVGRPTVENSVTLAADGEVIVSYERPLSLTYLDAGVEETAKTFLDAHRIATGDVGKFDRDGYLHLLGRKKQILITRGGYKLHPEMLEKEVERLPEVARAVVFAGEELPDLVVLVSLRGGRSPAAEARVESAIDQLNRTLPSAARLARAVYTDVQFTPDSGLLNRSLKLDRRAAYERFRALLLGGNAGDVGDAGDIGDAGAAARSAEGGRLKRRGFRRLRRRSAPAAGAECDRR